MNLEEFINTDRTLLVLMEHTGKDNNILNMYVNAVSSLQKKTSELYGGVDVHTMLRNCSYCVNQKMSAGWDFCSSHVVVDGLLRL